MKTAIVAGGNGGMGKATAVQLAQKGYRVIIHGRNAQKTQEALQEIKSKSGNKNVDAIAADVSSIAAMKKLAIDLQQMTDVVDVLVLSTGVIMPKRTPTADDLDMNFAAQYLCRFALVQGLMTQLKKSPFSRIVHVGAPLMKKAKIHFDDLGLKNNFTMFGSMGQAMLSNHLFVQEYARRHDGDNTVMNIMHVGIARTGVGRDSNWLLRTLINVAGKNPDVAAKNIVYLADDAEATFSGYFLHKPGRPQQKQKIQLDGTVAEQLWNRSLELVR